MVYRVYITPGTSSASITNGSGKNKTLSCLQSLYSFLVSTLGNSEEWRAEEVIFHIVGTASYMFSVTLFTLLGEDNTAPAGSAEGLLSAHELIQTYYTGLDVKVVQMGETIPARLIGTSLYAVSAKLKFNKESLRLLLKARRNCRIGDEEPYRFVVGVVHSGPDNGTSATYSYQTVEKGQLGAWTKLS